MAPPTGQMLTGGSDQFLTSPWTTYEVEDMAVELTIHYDNAAGFAAPHLSSTPAPAGR